jgi:hypothetical protein
MVNMLYDFVGVVPFVVPYAGFGIGHQEVIEQNPRIVPLGGVGGALASRDCRGSFAYRAILGAARQQRARAAKQACGDRLPLTFGGVRRSHPARRADLSAGPMSGNRRQ